VLTAPPLTTGELGSCPAVNGYVKSFSPVKMAFGQKNAAEMCNVRTYASGYYSRPSFATRERLRRLFTTDHTDSTDVRLPFIKMFAFDCFSFSFDSCDSW
jgi:hypothetical protein